MRLSVGISGANARRVVFAGEVWVSVDRFSNLELGRGRKMSLMLELYDFLVPQL
ncbi:unnamed protein product [Linum tenue]|uniref:Uncharacterized protein n=1 Tax=Linum tenue TaxID=586396 RepID=A0AAV0QD12_9ROSI|nr:unnamed protein product [Linum tenue]